MTRPDPDHHNNVLLHCSMTAMHTRRPCERAMRRDLFLAPFSAIVYHTQRTDSARAVLYEPASLILQSNSRPPHSFAAQPAVLVAACHECSSQCDGSYSCSASRSGNRKLYLHKTSTVASSYSSRHALTVSVAFLASVRRLLRRNRRSLYERASQRME